MILMSKALRYFIITAQEESIQSAASRLYITPSPLCRTIKAFEDTIGRKLFFRTKSGLNLTPYGHELYQKLMPIYKDAFFIEESFSRKKNNLNGPIKDFKIGIDHQEYSYLYPILSSKFIKESKCDISIDYFPPYDININSILNGNSCGIFFSFNEHNCSPEISHLKLPVDTFSLAVATKNIINNYSVEKYLSSYTLVYYYHHPSEPGWSSIDDYLKSNGISPRKIRVPTINDQLSMIENGDAIGIIPTSSKSIISTRNYKINLFELAPEENAIQISRHMYFLSKNRSLIEKNILCLLNEKQKNNIQLEVM